ncbi:MAG: Exonuclease small subunit, partial [Pseudomonadota bacterium]
MSEEPVETLTFEQSMAELEALVLRLETGDLPLADALATYQRGAG